MAFLSSCTEEFLNVKPDKRLSIPNTLEDLDALLNNRVFYAQASINLGIASIDDYYILDGQLTNTSSKYSKNAYIFAKDIFEDEESDDWNYAYERIFYANVVLSSIDTMKFSIEQQVLGDKLKGEALFHRASNYYQLLQLFCPQYDSTLANSAPCIPIRKDYDVSLSVSQGTVEEVYEFIIRDLEEGIALLPNFSTVYRPSKPAAHLLLARIYLHLEEYDNAYFHANEGLSYRSELVNFTMLDSTANYIFPADLETHPEIIYNHEGGAGPTTVSLARQNISAELHNMYEVEDLRGLMFFRTHTNGNIVFRGCYRPSAMLWAGYSTNELWLIRAEANIRLGDYQKALVDLNHLLKSRYREGEFKAIISNDSLQILDRILVERRKELIFRGSRWEDLKRLNKDSRLAKDLVRIIDGQQYQLSINSPNWVFPFPRLELDLNGWFQQPRE